MMPYRQDPKRLPAEPPRESWWPTVVVFVAAQVLSIFAIAAFAVHNVLAVCLIGAACAGAAAAALISYGQAMGRREHHRVWMRAIDPPPAALVPAFEDSAPVRTQQTPVATVRRASVADDARLAAESMRVETMQRVADLHAEDGECSCSTCDESREIVAMMNASRAKERC